MKRFFVTRPDFDLGTSYLFKWTEPLIKEAEDAGMQVIDVKGPDVNEKTVVGKLRALTPGLVCLNGHGGKDTYCGHRFETVLDSGSASALAGTTAYVRACACLDGLGKAAVKNGCKAFIGYSEDFIIPISDEFAATPLRDPVAKPVMEASNAIVERLIDGKTPETAVENSRKIMKEHVRRILYSKEYAEDLRFGDTLFALITNDGSLGVKE